MYNELIKKICEADTPFQPMQGEELAGFTKRRLKARSDVSKTGVKVLKMIIQSPITDSDESANMYAWWRNNNKWYRESPISKVEDNWTTIEFSFDTAIPLNDATKLVNDFVADWAGAVNSTDEKTPKVGDMVYLMTVGGQAHSWRSFDDSGKITSVEGGAVKIRFHHHGNVTVDAGKLTYNLEKNSWETFDTAEFKQSLTAKKGIPKEGTRVDFILPKELWKTHPASQWSEERIDKDGRGNVVSADETNTVVEWVAWKDDYRTPDVHKQITIPTKDLQYSWTQKRWKQIGLEE